MPKKSYAIAPYGSTWAMYESSDFRLRDLSPILKGTFTKSNTYKGMINGGEIGYFDTIIGDRFIVFYDHSATQIR